MFLGVQILRGVAALMVVLIHSSLLLGRHSPFHIPSEAGAAGVDIFFAISGFVMAVVTANSWGQPNIANAFLVRRIIRVVPTYWIITLLKCALMLLIPSLIMNTELSWLHLGTSLFFVPVTYQWPILQVGWTLSFEMFFYLVFALALSLTSRPAYWCSLLFGTMVAVGLTIGRSWGPLPFLLNPLLIEFVFGLLVGLATVRGLFLSKAAAAALACVSGLALFSSNFVEAAESYRVLWWGVPGFLLLASVVALEPSLRSYPIRPLVDLGAASYSLYLTHTIVLGAVWAVATKVIPMNGLGAFMVYALGVAASIAIAWIFHRSVELPLTGALARMSYSRSSK